jgi:hypothetical protein
LCFFFHPLLNVNIGTFVGHGLTNACGAETNGNKM